ncbi:hypothetical protein [Jidongwangia harbinensis]|uniref:hypothetical protein n=1 Tax=Jidongwangia harbinensis TaxID=2878561 RepID=UPI001CD9CE2F|nr:hypothetical protein [Jidongwangia harbinensis]MCA2212124.1 hypothetical protein [Jidongwangia harbinensis]
MTNSTRRRWPRQALRVLGGTVAATGLLLGGTSLPASAAGNPYTPRKVCGSGYGVQRAHALPGATVYQLFNGRTNCVVTIKTAAVGRPTKITAGLRVAGSSWAYDTGRYAYYAGPVKQAGAGKCVRYFGYSGGRNYTGPWGNCG